MSSFPTSEAALLKVMSSLDARLIRRGAADVPYLWRAYLGDRDASRKHNVGAFLHRFVSSDEFEWHLHPWAWSYGFILSGAYSEDRILAFDVDFKNKDASLDGSTRRKKIFRAGDTNLIAANVFHRVDLVSPEVWTLFIHGPRVQDWGFVPMGTYVERVPMRIVEGHTRDRLPREAVR